MVEVARWKYLVGVKRVSAYIEHQIMGCVLVSRPIASMLRICIGVNSRIIFPYIQTDASGHTRNL